MAIVRILDMINKLHIPIPREKIGECFQWRDWFQKLSDKVYGTIAVQNADTVSITGGDAALDSLTTKGLTGYLYGHDSSSHVTATTTIPATDITGIAAATDHNDLSGLQGGATGEYYHLSLSNYTKVNSPPHIEVYDLSTSITVGSTPFLLKPATTVSGSQGILYDSSTGEFTFTNAGTYVLSINLNCNATAANQKIYVWAELFTGGVWVTQTQSGKIINLVNGQEFQAINAQAVYRVAGQKVRYWIYSSDSHTNLLTDTLPGISSTVYCPAIRFQFTG